MFDENDNKPNPESHDLDTAFGSRRANDLYQKLSIEHRQKRESINEMRDRLKRERESDNG